MRSDRDGDMQMGDAPSTGNSRLYDDLFSKKLAYRLTPEATHMAPAEAVVSLRGNLQVRLTA